MMGFAVKADLWAIAAGLVAEGGEERGPPNLGGWRANAGWTAAEWRPWCGCGEGFNEKFMIKSTIVVGN